MKKILLVGMVFFAFVFNINAQLISEGFESGFVNYQNASGNTNQFALSSSIFHLGSKSAFNSYTNNSYDTLYQSTTVDLTTTTAPQLIFWQICKVEGYSDEGRVLISTDSGATYSTLPGSSYMGASTGFDGYASAGYFDEYSYTTWNASPVQNSWWKRESFDLSAYTAFNNVKIMFLLVSDGFSQTEGWYIDDISVKDVTCPLVSGLSSFGVTTNSANVTWVSGAADSLWQIEYDLAGFTIGSGTQTTFSANDTVGISSLLANTAYDFYVRSICKSGDTSDWQGFSQFTTGCNLLVPPYVQNFDLMTLSTGYSCYTQDDLSDCWSNELSTMDYWRVESGSTNTNNTGPSFDNTTGTGNYIYMESSTNANCSSGDKSILYGPSIDLSTTPFPQLSFYYHMWGVSVDSLNVFVSNDNGVTWTKEWGLYGDQTNNWNEAIVPLTTYFGDTIIVKFEARKGSSYTGDIGIDDFSVTNVPACPKPTVLGSYNLFPDSVDLTWVNGANDSTWIVEYGLSGFALGSGTVINSTIDSVSIGGLMSNTTYNVYVRSFCDVADTSLWFGPYSFTTPCSAFIPPYTQDFSTMTSSIMPTCWKEAEGLLATSSTLVYGASEWRSDGFGNIGTTGAARTRIYGTSINDWLISPSFDLGNGSSPYIVEFNVALTPYTSSNPTSFNSDDKFYLIISTDNGVTWSDTNVLERWDISNMPSNTGDYYYFNLTTAGYTGLVKFGLYAESTVSGSDNNLTIDNFGVIPLPSCPRPINLMFDSSSSNSANVSWTNGSSDVSWVLEYGAPGFVQGTGTVVGSSSNPALIPGLSPATCYDVYLRSVCTAGDSSIWIGPIDFCTKCVPVIDLCEDFEGTLSGEIPICWEEFVISNGNSSIQVNPSGGNFTPSGIQLSAGNDGGATMFLISPEMSALGLQTHRASFWVKGSSSPDSVLIVGTIADITNPATFTPWDTINTVTSSYQFFKIPFDTYTGTDTRIAFQYVATSVSRSMTIDDFCFEVIPSCDKAIFPTVLNAGIDSSSLGLGWTGDPTHTSYIINYGLAGYHPVSNPVGGFSATSTTNFFTAVGLNSLSEYCFWIKAVCVNGDTSEWTVPVCGTTGCPAAVSLPYSDDFSTYTNSSPMDITPLCWTEAEGGLTASGSLIIRESEWEADGFANLGSSGAARIFFSPFGRSQAWLLTPVFDLGNDLNANRFIEFDVALTDYFNSGPSDNGFGADDTVAFVASFDGGLTWKTSDILIQWDTNNEPSSTGTHIQYLLSNTIGKVQFGFYGVTSVNNEGVDFFVDNFSIRDSVYAGVDEIDGVTNFKVYPNPNNGQFTILNEGNASKSSVKVVDVQGRVVYEDSYYFSQNGRKQVDLTSLNSGVYILILEGEGKQEQHRVILNK